MAAKTTYLFYSGCTIMASEPSAQHPMEIGAISQYYNFNSEKRLLLLSPLGTIDLSGKYITGSRLIIKMIENGYASYVPYFRAAALNQPSSASTATWDNTDKLDATAVGSILSLNTQSVLTAVLSFSAEQTQKIISNGLQLFTHDTVAKGYIWFSYEADYIPNVTLEVEYLDDEPLSTVVLRYPVGAILNGGVENTFTWETVNEVGTAQSKFDLQLSQDGKTWADAATENTSRTSYTFLPDSLSSGAHYWRVRAYNQSDVPGAWSDEARFIVIAAPASPIITVVESTPRFVLTWTQQGQQGYEIELDGVLIASSFGMESRYQYPAWAEPGAHTVRVRIQNEYSLWSDWGAAALTIVNTPGAAISLTAVIDPDTTAVTLSWTGAADRYVVYRNGESVGETAQQSFSDQFAAGACTYQVRGVSDSNGYYTISDPVAVTILPENLMLYDIRNKVWLNLARSATQTRDTKETMTRAASFLHFAGSAKPSVEFGEDIDRSISFVCAFVADEYDEKEKFEASIGGMVCLKLPDGKSIVGAMSAYTRNATTFYTVYQASVVEAEFDEVASNG